jgi:hypothetical protein
MNRPSLSVRVAGSALGALVLFLGCGALVVAWYQGGVPWWVGVAAVAGVGRTLTAVKRVRRYKAWAAEWEAMGADNQPRPARKSAGHGGGALVAGAALLVVVIPFELPPAAAARETLIAVWCVACLILVWKLVGLFRRASVRRQERQRVKAEAEPVAWLMGRASSSPSRAEAQGNLPEYSARVMEWESIARKKTA